LFYFDRFFKQIVKKKNHYKFCCVNQEYNAAFKEQVLSQNLGEALFRSRYGKKALAVSRAEVGMFLGFCRTPFIRPKNRRKPSVCFSLTLALVSLFSKAPATDRESVLVYCV
jgi:hypothetical protein